MLQLELLQCSLYELRIEPAVDADVAADEAILLGLASLRAVLLEEIIVDQRRIPILEHLFREVAAARGGRPSAPSVQAPSGRALSRLPTPNPSLPEGGE